MALVFSRFGALSALSRSEIPDPRSGFWPAPGRSAPQVGLQKQNTTLTANSSQPSPAAARRRWGSLPSFTSTLPGVRKPCFTPSSSSVMAGKSHTLGPSGRTGAGARLPPQLNLPSRASGRCRQFRGSRCATGAGATAEIDPELEMRQILVDVAPEWGDFAPQLPNSRQNWRSSPKLAPELAESNSLQNWPPKIVRAKCGHHRPKQPISDRTPIGAQKLCSRIRVLLNVG